MPSPPSGTVTFLFTDVEGSAAHWERDRAAMAAAVAQHDAIIAAAVSANQGYLYKHVGDAVQAAFATAGNALTAAVTAQRTLVAESWRLPRPLRVRMALHTGEAAPDPAGDYHQVAALNRLSRILSAAHGDQIVLSQAARDLAGAELPPEISLRDLGEHRLRDLLEPERLWQVHAPGLPSDFPPPRGLERHLTNLPVQLTPLVGRETNVAAVQRLFQEENARLVTLTGPGGTGKTRLALAIAAELLDAFPGGVWFVDLGPVADPELVPSAIAAALGVRETAAQPLSLAVAAFITSKRLLLVLDNFEHLLEAATVVSDLLRAAPALAALITSREVLHLRGEREVAVAPLAIPDPERLPEVAALAQIPAVTLFIQRAQAAKADFALTETNAAAVTAICRRLDGLPLAIELAAARVKLLPPAALLSRLDDSLALLTGGARDAPARQRTLRDAIAWSHNLLSPDAQTLFRRLAVFGGGCTLEAAEAIANVDGTLDVLGALASLVDESLLRQEEGIDGEPRFRMLETIREFALERLVASGEEDTIRGRQASWFLDQAEEISNAFETGFPVDIVEQLDAEYANFTAALHWLERTGQGEALLRLAGATAMFWYLSGHYGEGRAWLERALAAAPDMQTAARVRALGRSGLIAQNLGQSDVAAARLEQSAALARRLGLANEEADAILERGLVDEDGGAYDEAETRFLAARELFQRIGRELGAATATYHLGIVAYGRGELARACEHWEEALTTARRLGDAIVATWCLDHLGLAAVEQGDLARAAALLREPAAHRHMAAFRHTHGSTLETVAVLASACGQTAAAARLQGAAAAAAARARRDELPEGLAYQRTERHLRDVLGDAAYERAWTEGRRFRPDEIEAAVAAILDTARHAGSDHADWGGSQHAAS